MNIFLKRNTHLKHIFGIFQRHRPTLPNGAVASIIIHDVNSSESLFGLLERSIDIFLALDVDFNDEEFVRTVLRLVSLHRFGLADRSDDGVSFGEEVLSDGETHAIASASNGGAIRKN